ncbi:hypothetical protein AGABI1DRAFT_126568 [Agaricus bisporus var. burnettii JB137-S8]|uniref:Uncharacterized protein n=1 Tax=Agaricus bisporus var. burnettii (strain JB137-S8 / ATCC MYA-4627 / FGSC 10392) TaxID=597362 RepID=K5XG70_AGABU|nr:uncharacterized protein AGABI1DRAFT_126568 [Agaricus bisporus var. burnettii JB137-S8]EKM82237.1 hypothetical protein AGABI1DRAFT_126568 [Agaricus bisporus var. burnettii JB137-S8]
MASYIPEYVQISNACALNTPPHLRPANAKDVPPAAPLMVSLPLPSSPLSDTTQSTDLEFYPIRILSPLPLSQMLGLRETTLISPIHVHTPHFHIGTIHASTPGQEVNSLDLVLFLRNLAQNPLGFHRSYIHLSQQMKYEVKAAFFHRRGHSPLSTLPAMLWEQFVSGVPTPDGPTGEDLLLGNTSLWGLEGRSVHECSIIHLA